jgi:hypothetical protein
MRSWPIQITEYLPSGDKNYRRKPTENSRYPSRDSNQALPE